jgi:hypothetical protein
LPQCPDARTPIFIAILLHTHPFDARYRLRLRDAGVVILARSSASVIE